MVFYSIENITVELHENFSQISPACIRKSFLVVLVMMKQMRQLKAHEMLIFFVLKTRSEIQKSYPLTNCNTKTWFIHEVPFLSKMELHIACSRATLPKNIKNKLK